MPRRALCELIELCHEHDVLVSTGNFIDYVLTRGSGMVTHDIDESKP
jgi:hypothetical protein